MADYNHNFQENRPQIEAMITYGIPDLAREMEKNNLISAEDKFQILKLKSPERVKKLLDIIEKKKCFGDFIEILSNCGLRDCVDIIRGNAEIRSDSAQLESDLQTARDKNRQLLGVISRLEREKEGLMLNIRYLQVELESMYRRDKIYKQKCDELYQTRNKLTQVEEQLTQIKSEDVTESTHLHGELQETKAEVQSLRQDMKERNIRMESKLDQLLNHFAVTSMAPPVEPVPTRQSSAQCVKLPPIKKGK